MSNSPRGPSRSRLWVAVLLATALGVGITLVVLPKEPSRGGERPKEDPGLQESQIRIYLATWPRMRSSLPRLTPPQMRALVDQMARENRLTVQDLQALWQRVNVAANSYRWDTGQDLRRAPIEKRVSDLRRDLKRKNLNPVLRERMETELERKEQQLQVQSDRASKADKEMVARWWGQLDPLVPAVAGARRGESKPPPEGG